MTDKPVVPLVGSASPAHRLARAVLFGIAYYLIEQGSLALVAHGTVVSEFWLPSGLLLAVLLRTRRVEWFELLAVAFFAGTVHPGFARVALQTTFANVIEGLVGATVLRNLLGPAIRLNRIRDVLAISFIPGLVSVPIGAGLVAASLHFNNGTDFLTTWRLTWIANSMGVLALTPFLLSWSSERPRFNELVPARVRHFTLIWVAALVASVLMVQPGRMAQPLTPYGWLFIPLFLWTALQFGAREISTLSMTVCLVVASYAASGVAPFGLALTVDQTMIIVDMLLSILTYSALLIAAAGAESRHALRASEASAEKYRSLFEDSIEGIFRSAPDGTFLVANPALARMHGFETPEELMRNRTTHNTYVNPDDRVQLLDQLRRDGFVQSHSLHVVKRNGEEAWHSLNARLVKDEAGELQYFEGMVEDVTERKLAELDRQRLTTSLSERVKELSTVHQVSRILQRDELSIPDILERIVATTPPAFQFPEITAARIRTLECEMTSAGFHETPWMLRATYPMADGVGIVLDVVYLEERPADAEGPFFLEERHLVDSLVEMIGVTLQRRETEAAFLRSQERLQLALSAAGMLVWEYTVDTKQMAWSGSITAATGVDPADAPESLDEFLAIIHPDDRDHILRALDNALNDPAHNDVFEAEYRRGEGDGAMRWISSGGRVQRDEQGNAVTIRGLSRDVTGLRQLEQQFHQSQKLEAIGQLAGGVAHDFNNLLTVMSGYLEMLLNDDLTLEEQRAALEELERVTHRAESLTRQLLAFSRKNVVAPVMLDMNDQIGGMEKLLKRLIGERITLVLDLGRDAGRVRADPAQMEQMVMNIAVNARDAMQTGGTLRITTAAEQFTDSKATALGLGLGGSWFVMSVTDTGHGMDEATRTRIFEPFFTTKDLGKGTGMGLSVVLGVVERNLGRVHVQSTPNVGTTFTVYLPIVADQDVPAIPPRVSQPTPRRGNEAILLVEDDDALRYVVTMALEAHGYTVSAARHGEEALEILASEKRHYDLLLTDVVLPKVGGRELATRIFGHDANTRVLYMSGYTDDAVLVHGVEAGQVNFLQKPFAPTVLVKKVREVLDA